VGFGAAICGAILLLFPSGSPMQMSVDMLRNSPFHDFLLPGIILFLVNGIGQFAAAVMTIKKHRWAGYGGAVFGLGLMIWIFVQVNMIGGGHFLQYSYFMIGIVETSLSFLIQDVLSSTSTGKKEE
jgi:hypothetical protein